MARFSFKIDHTESPSQRLVRIEQQKTKWVVALTKYGQEPEHGRAGRQARAQSLRTSCRIACITNVVVEDAAASRSHASEKSLAGGNCQTDPNRSDLSDAVRLSPLFLMFLVKMAAQLERVGFVSLRIGCPVGQLRTSSDMGFRPERP
jgi:hypothetical protein